MTQPLQVLRPPHAPQPVQVWSKSCSKEGHFTLEAETVIRPYHARHCCRVTQTSHVVLPPNAPELLQVLSKSVRNKGHFTLEAGAVFRILQSIEAV
jgi:hypothetical protein